MRTIFRPHVNGGLAGSLIADGRTVPIVVTWNNASACISLDESRIDRSLSGTDLVGWLLAQIGSHAVEFSQALVSASPCLSAKDLQAQADALSEAMKPLASESEAAAPPADSTTPPQTVVAGVSIAPAAEKPARTRTRKAAAVTPVQSAQAAQDPPTVEVAPQAPPPAASVAGTSQPAGDPSAFVEQMADVSARQEAARSPAEPRFREPPQAPPVTAVTGGQEPPPPVVEEHRVVPEPDFLDQMVDLLFSPPMPPDVCPVDWQRSPADQRYADTALTRLSFRRCLEPEYQQAGPGRYQPVMPAREHMIVDPSTPQGVTALVQLLFAVNERAAQRGVEIPQLTAWLSMYPGPDGLRAACESAWYRIDGRRQQAAQRLTAMQAQAQPVQSAPNYAAPHAHGQHPNYAPPQPAYQPQHQGHGGYAQPHQAPPQIPAAPQYYPPR